MGQAIAKGSPPPPPPAPMPTISEADMEVLKRIFRNLSDTKQEVAETIVGTDAGTIKKGTGIVQKSRVISGNYNRCAILFDTLDSLGLDTLDERSSIFGSTIGFSPELYPTGLRGEALDLVRPTPKKEPLTPITQNIMSNPQNNNGGSQE